MCKKEEFPGLGAEFRASTCGKCVNLRVAAGMKGSLQGSTHKGRFRIQNLLRGFYDNWNGARHALWNEFHFESGTCFHDLGFFKSTSDQNTLPFNLKSLNKVESRFFESNEFLVTEKYCVLQSTVYLDPVLEFPWGGEVLSFEFGVEIEVGGSQLVKPLFPHAMNRGVVIQNDDGRVGIQSQF